MFVSSKMLLTQNLGSEKWSIDFIGVCELVVVDSGIKCGPHHVCQDIFS